ncbi:MAG: GDP-mannose 4,6-dehydratase [Candidatus Marinimicrobia bacterium]|nr:GDP-mannose 4,6-dehydratase [Candidatus Neomarinimicrobiota bacterium]
MKFLITGGCGFVGSNLAAHILGMGEELAVLDNLTRHGAEQNRIWLNSLGKFKFVEGNISDEATVNGLIKDYQPEAIFHLAGQVAMTTSLINPRMDFETNDLGTFNLLEAVRQYAPDAAILYSSTNKVYGDLENYRYIETDTRYECLDRPQGFDENTPLNFRTPYGASKGSADQYMLDYAHMFGLKTIVFRHSSMYGSRQFPTYDQGWIGWFCLKARDIKAGTLEKPFTISGNGKQVRDVLHADDVIRLYLAALDRAENLRGEVFNIGGGMKNSLSLLELFQLIETLLPIRMNFQELPPRKSDQLVFVADITKAHKMLSWQPQVSPRDGVSQLLV